MNVSGGKIGKMYEFCVKRFFRFQSVVRVRSADGLFDTAGVELPQLERMVHATRHNVIAVHVKIGRKYFVAMTFDSSKCGNTMVSLDIPKT